METGANRRAGLEFLESIKEVGGGAAAGLIVSIVGAAGFLKSFMVRMSRLEKNMDDHKEEVDETVKDMLSTVVPISTHTVCSKRWEERFKIDEQRFLDGKEKFEKLTEAQNETNKMLGTIQASVSKIAGKLEGLN